MINLSKSRYCSGIQCPKILWMEKHMPECASETANEAVLENGTKVGELAREYFGGYFLVPYDADKGNMCRDTERLLGTDAENIAEASFAFNGLYCAVDILHRNGDGWDIVEVKSSTEAKDIYLHDMAFQHYVLTNCGVKVKRVFLLHIDSTYVFHDRLDIQRLFLLEDHTADCLALYGDVARNIRAIREYNETETEPERDIGLHCHAPYGCAFFGYCSRHLPEKSVFDIANLKTKKKYELYYSGIVSYEDVIRNNVKLTPNQRRQVETAACHLPPDINREKIREFLDTISYPVYHLDFETFQLAVPEYEGCRPYCQIPFQYSLHVEHADGTLEHREFLAEEGKDPRRAIAESLCRDIPMGSFCMAFNMSFENTRIRELAAIFPDLSEHLLNMVENMHDLMVPFQKQYYYCEELQGSYSIKYVLPALCPGDPELDYTKLEGVHKGDEASAAFASLPDRTPEEIAVIRAQLLKYCGLDTYAMVKVLQKLREACGIQ